MNKNLKKLAIYALTLATLSTSTISAFAWPWPTLSASGHRVVQMSNGNAYASGFTTSTSSHYTNVRLYAGNQMRESGRVWGTGQVSAQSGTAQYVQNQTGSAVYWGY